MDQWTSQPWWTGATAGLIAFAVPASVRPETLAEGGLAPLVAATAVGLAIGWPCAAALWRATPGRATPWTPWTRGLGRLLLPVTLSAVWASVHPGIQGFWIAALLWLGVGLGLRSRAAHFAAGAAALAVVQAPAAAAITSVESVPWTLLEPAWSNAEVWLAPSLIAGLMLAGVGFGQWERARPSPPGTQTVPLIPVCTAVLAAVGMAVALSARHGAQRMLATDSMSVLVALGCLVAAVSSAISRGDRGTVAAGVASHAWFLWAGPETVTWWMAVWLPLGWLVVLGEAASRPEREQRWPIGLAAAVALVALALGVPERPAEMGSALTAALTGVLTVWWVGARVALEAR